MGGDDYGMRDGIDGDRHYDDIGGSHWESAERIQTDHQIAQTEHDRLGAYPQQTSETTAAPTFETTLTEIVRVFAAEEVLAKPPAKPSDSTLRLDRLRLAKAKANDNLNEFDSANPEPPEAGEKPGFPFGAWLVAQIALIVAGSFLTDWNDSGPVASLVFLGPLFIAGGAWLVAQQEYEESSEAHIQWRGQVQRENLASSKELDEAQRQTVKDDRQSLRDRIVASENDPKWNSRIKNLKIVAVEIDRHRGCRVYIGSNPSPGVAEAVLDDIRVRVCAEHRNRWATRRPLIFPDEANDGLVSHKALRNMISGSAVRSSKVTPIAEMIALPINQLMSQHRRTWLQASTETSSSGRYGLDPIGLGW